MAIGFPAAGDVNEIGVFMAGGSKRIQKQINTLHGLADDARLKDIYEVQSIKITKYTNLFDKDKDGKKETLIVYIQPVDQDGDIIKAAGDVHVQLLKLDKDQDPDVLGKWHITQEELRKLWLNALLKTNYRLTFDVSDKVESNEEPLTVMVTFTDYLTGRELGKVLVGARFPTPHANLPGGNRGIDMNADDVVDLGLLENAVLDHEDRAARRCLLRGLEEELDVPLDLFLSLLQ